MNYKLNKQQKGKKFEYTVTDENGNIISKRSSTRDYVACTANGEFYFGRLDLIGKGDHGSRISQCEAMINNPDRVYCESVMSFTPDLRAEWKANNPYEEWKAFRTDRAVDTLEELKAIAYL